MGQSGSPFPTLAAVILFALAAGRRAAATLDLQRVTSGAAAELQPRWWQFANYRVLVLAVGEQAKTNSPLVKVLR